MVVHQRGTGCPIERDINLHMEDTEGQNSGPDNDNESTSGSDTAIAFGESEADGHPNEVIPSNQAKLTALVREIMIYINVWRLGKANQQKVWTT